MSYKYTRYIVKKISIFILFQLLLLIIEVFFVRANAQNNVNNPWLAWYPEIISDAGSDAPFSAFSIKTSTNTLTDFAPNCYSFTIGNDLRGYVYYDDKQEYKLNIVEPRTQLIVGSVLEPAGFFAHAVYGFYISATNKHYIAVTGTGVSLATSAIYIYDVTNVGATSLVNTITIPGNVVCEQNANATSSGAAVMRMPGMVLYQTAYTSADTKLFFVIDDGVKAGSTETMGFTGADILHPGIWGGITDPLGTTVVSSAQIHETIYTPGSSSDALYPDLGNVGGAHQLAYDPTNDVVYITAEADTKDVNKILGFHASSTFTPAYVIYKVGTGTPGSPGGVPSNSGYHGVQVNRAGTSIYTGRRTASSANADEDRALKFTITSDGTAAAIKTVTESAASPSFSAFSGYAFTEVKCTNLSPDEQYVYSSTFGGGSGSGSPLQVASIWSLNPSTLAIIGSVQKSGGGNAVFNTIDPHSYAYTLSDFGDAPSSYGIPLHNLNNLNYVDDKLRIGNFIDGDTSATNSTNWDSDDNAKTGGSGTGLNTDEDGITTAIKNAAKSLYFGMSGTYSINNIVVKNTTPNPAILVGWIDFNHDGIFQTTEGTTTTVAINAATASLIWTIPATVTTGTVPLRLRLSTDNSLTTATPGSIVIDGEVEDHKYPTSLTVSGSVFADGNGNTIFGSTGAAGSGENGTTAGVALYAYLIINGIIVDSSNVSITGVYNFLNAPQNAGNTTIVIGTNSLAPGTASAGIIDIATNPPTDWVFTGSSAATSSNGNSNSLSVNLGTNTITGLNFGIEKRPDTNPVTQSVASPTGGSIAAGTITTPVSGTDEEDGALGNGKTVKITNLPGNATMYYLGAVVTANQILLNFNPANVSYSGIQNGSTSVVFNYAFIDAAGQQDLSPASFTVNWLTALPINLESFTGTAKDCNSITLNWKVSDAVNFNRFVVERSKNGIDFEKIGSVFYDFAIANYSFSETVIDKGSYQYRMKMIDTDGKFKYSPVVLIRLDCNQQKIVIVYPNPVKDKITINGLKGGEQITLYNAQGQIVYNKKNTEYQLNIDISTVVNGMYHLIITDKKGDKISESKIVKIN